MNPFHAIALEARMIKASVEYADAIRQRGRTRGKPDEIRAGMRSDMFQMVGKADAKLVKDIKAYMNPQQIDAALIDITKHPIIAPVLEL